MILAIQGKRVPCPCKEEAANTGHGLGGGAVEAQGPIERRLFVKRQTGFRHFLFGFRGFLEGDVGSERRIGNALPLQQFLVCSSKK